MDARSLNHPSQRLYGEAFAALAATVV